MAPARSPRPCLGRARPNDNGGRGHVLRGRCSHIRQARVRVLVAAFFAAPAGGPESNAHPSRLGTVAVDVYLPSGNHHHRQRSRGLPSSSSTSNTKNSKRARLLPRLPLLLQLSLLRLPAQLKPAELLSIFSSHVV